MLKLNISNCKTYTKDGEEKAYWRTIGALKLVGDEDTLNRIKDLLPAVKMFIEYDHKDKEYFVFLPREEKQENNESVPF